MNPIKHIPWKFIESDYITDSNGAYVAEGVNDQTAAFIVRAVNSHDELLSALKACHPPADQEKHKDYSGACAACKAISKAEAHQ